jgi:hypothetical protein
MSSRLSERVYVLRATTTCHCTTPEAGARYDRGAFPERGEVEPLAMSGRGLPFFLRPAPPVLRVELPAADPEGWT